MKFTKYKNKSKEDAKIMEKSNGKIKYKWKKKKKRQGCQKGVWERGTLPLNVPQKGEKKCKKVM